MTSNSKQNEFRKKNYLSPVKLKLVEVHLKILVKKKKAWQLIKEAGCDKFSEGDAMISKNIVIFLLIMEKQTHQILKN